LSTRRSPIAVVPAAVLVLVSAWEMCATRRDAAAVPDDAAWDRASEIVRAAYAPGDLIVFAPDWIDPVGRLHLGDLIPIDTAARMDADSFGHIWELSIRGARAPDTVGLEPVKSTEVGGVTVREFRRTPVTVVSDVRTQLAAATVTGGAKPQLVLAEVGFAPHRCIQAVPAPGGAIRITFPQLMLGTRLVGDVGLADVFTRRDVRLPGTLEVQLGNQTIARATPGVDDGWVRFEAATTPGPADVTFVASAGPGATNRLICFAAQARR
jgi:hypothetical protein